MTQLPTRKASTPIKVWCLPEEHQGIAANARAAGLSKSAYLRQVGLAHEVKSVVDFEKLMQLSKINGDLGRLGGLLKLWLTKPEKLAPFGTAKVKGSIEAALVEITATQAELRRTVELVLKA